MIEFSEWSIDLNISSKKSNLILYSIIWRREFMLVSINDLTLLTFFHMLFDEFSDIFHSEYDFSFSESIDSISNRVFFKLNVIEAHSWFEFVVDKKRRHMSDDWNESIKCVFCHKQSICSIVLLMIDVSTKIAFHFLIENLALFIRFRVKCDE